MKLSAKGRRIGVQKGRSIVGRQMLEEMGKVDHPYRKLWTIVRGGGVA